MEYGNGVGTVHWTDLTPEALAGHIKTCLGDEEIISRAAKLGQKLRERDGPKETADHLIRFLCETVWGGAYWKGFNRFAAQKKENAVRSWFPGIQVLRVHWRRMLAILFLAMLARFWRKRLNGRTLR